MTREELSDRLAAVERALTDEETTPADLSESAALDERLDALDERLAALEGRLADVEGDVAAVRGRVEGIDRETEQVAQRALATARAVEQRLDEETPRPRRRPVPVESSDDESLVDRLRERW